MSVCVVSGKPEDRIPTVSPEKTWDPASGPSGLSVLSLKEENQ